MKRLGIVIDDEMDETLANDVKNATKFKYIQSKSALGYAYLMAGIEVFEAALANDPLAVDIWMRAEAKMHGIDLDAQARRGKNSAIARAAEARKALIIEEERREVAEAMPKKRGKITQEPPSVSDSGAARGRGKGKKSQDNA